jgi:hypothetical protein
MEVVKCVLDVGLGSLEELQNFLDDVKLGSWGGVLVFGICFGEVFLVI